MSESRLWILGGSDPEMEATERTLRECGERVVYAKTAAGERVRPGQQAAPIHIGDATTVYTVECDPPLACGEPEDEPDMGQVILNGSRYMAARCCVEISVIRIDHHCPGDPGYGRPPSEFLAASSIGQVVAELARLDLWPPPGDGCGRDWTPTNCRPMWFGKSYEDPHGVGGWWIVGEDSGGCCHRLPYALVPHDLVLIAAADHCLGAAYAGECPGVDPDALMRWRAESRAKFQGRRDPARGFAGGYLP